MDIKTVLVHVDETASCDVRFEVALQLALAYQAHLVGLYTSRIYALEWNKLTKENAKSLESDTKGEQTHAALEERSSRAGLNMEWRSIKVKDEADIGLHARYADLVVVGQPDPKDALYTSPEFPALLALTVARPVLVVPHHFQFGPLGDHILVAWNRSREATRAITDALALLKRAQKVTVLVAGESTGPSGSGEEPGADIALYLARHGANVQVQYDKTSDDPTTVTSHILSYAAHVHADLIVMGAYGHWRLRETLLGGVTRSMVRETNIPVVMSH